MVVAEVTVKSDEAFWPKSTEVAPVNPEPEILMVSPPPAVPLDGVSACIDTGSLPVLDPPLGRSTRRSLVSSSPTCLLIAGTAIAPVAGEP